MKPEALAKWEKLRAKGRTRYILVNGVLSYGLPMFIFMTFFVHQNDLTPISIGFSAMVWAACGAVFGALTWRLLEWQYRKATHDSAA